MKLLLLPTFFIITPLFIFLNLIFYQSLSYQKEHKNHLAQNAQATIAYAALPGTYNKVHYSINPKDIRIDILSDFFKKYRSQLLPYAENIVLSADKYGIDYRLVTAIAMQESNLCKKAPKNSHNCWGFGIYGKNSVKFNNYPEAVEAVTKTLAVDYKDKGLITPEQIMSKYTPASKGSWARGVTHFMEQLRVDL